MLSSPGRWRMMSAPVWCPRALWPTTGRTHALAPKPPTGAEPFMYASALYTVLSPGGIWDLAANM